MEILVFEGGCACTAGLLPLLKKVLAESGRNDFIYVSRDINKMIELGIMGLPALVVDGKVVCEGEIPDEQKLKQILNIE